MKKGFTLIELLIVVSIIGILATALIPSISGAQSRARDASRMSAVKDAVAAAVTYSIDNGNFPAAGATSNCMGGAAWSSYYTRDELPAISSLAAIDDCDSGTETHPRYVRYPDGYLMMVLVENTEQGNIDHNSAEAAANTGAARALLGESGNAFAVVR